MHHVHEQARYAAQPSVESHAGLELVGDDSVTGASVAERHARDRHVGGGSPSCPLRPGSAARSPRTGMPVPRSRLLLWCSLGVT